jgi:HEAT repeat protein
VTRKAALLMACLAASISFDAVLPAAPTTTPSSDPATVLADQTSPAARREEAARILLRGGGESAKAAIQHALEDSSDQQGQLSTAKAIAATPNADPAFLVPLRLMMGTNRTDRTLTEAAAQALASYRDSPEALRLLINFASARQQHEADRLAAVRAIGTLNEKAAAEFLMSLLLRDDDAPRIRNAAGDALIDMTGQFENGHDVRAWQAWWNASSAKSDAQWKQELIARQASRFVQMRAQYEQLSSELQNILTRVYETTPAAQQPALIMTYLRSTHPEVRRFGAMMVYNEAMAARPVPPEAKEQLRAMVGDSSREVRLAAANALLATNDPGALDSLLKQLEREADPEVRAALAAPLASIGDLKAVPALRRMLQDKSVATATAGAAALRELGPVIREHPPLARDVARDLRGILDQTPEGAGAASLREAIAEALVPLRDPEMVPTLYRLLREAGSTRIRWAALRALGELGDPKAADTIARYLEDRESGVRLEAVRALAKTSAPEHAEELYRRMNAVEEIDPAVREEAWNVLKTTFPKLPLEQLPSFWVKQFSADPAKRLVVVRAWVDQLATTNNPGQLASARQVLGATLLELGQPADAAVQFRLALDYFLGAGNQEMVVEQLVNQYLLSLLRARDYTTAQTFASELLGQKTAYQQTVGVLLRNEVRRLGDERRWADVMTLSETAQRITPTLAPRYLEEIATIEKDARANLPSTLPSAR